MRTLIRSVLSIVFLIIFSAQVTIAQWENVSTGIGNRPVYSLYNNSNYIYAGSSNHGLYLSSDNGTNWNPAGVNYFNITYAVTEFGGYLYAACELGVWRTSNNGAYWSYTSLNNTTMYSLASNQSRVFVGSHNSGLFYSAGGTGWFISQLNTQSVKALAVNGTFLLAGCGNSEGVFISTNNGTNWSSSSLNYKSVYSLSLNGNIAFAGTGSGVYYSSDSGYTWTQTSLNNELVYSLAVSGSNVFAGTELHGVFVSEDNGVSWTQRNEGLGNITIHSLRIVNNYLFAGASANGVYRRQIGNLVGLITKSNEMPENTSLYQNYPNPFNPSTTIMFSIAKNELVTLAIYNSAGQKVRILTNDHFEPGSYEIEWDASGLSSGVYFYTLSTPTFLQTKKMLLIK
ncbi:MAG TPA: T9SS type A sorting domain-containing protein [Ignavibacteria bacterium]|nr:T9SS type A sorting domain-containing protein [Ignavibacteria bacterium]HMQ97465.1 T9SS type A sorting domain-containing protein [Ignavibacteria bacterium]